MTRRPYFVMPERVAGTVFDPLSPTFGPIMAAIQAGNFETARSLLAGLTRPTQRESLYDVLSEPAPAREVLVAPRPGDAQIDLQRAWDVLHEAGFIEPPERTDDSVIPGVPLS